MDGQGWHHSKSKGKSWGEGKVRLQAAWGVWETQCSGTKHLTSIPASGFVICAHCFCWGQSVQGWHSWVQIVSFTHTQGLLGRSHSLCKLVGLVFSHLSVKPEHSYCRLCRAHRGTCWYLCVSSWAALSFAGLGLVHILPFLLLLPAAPSDSVVWFWLWEPLGKQSL